MRPRAEIRRVIAKVPMTLIEALDEASRLRVVKGLDKRQRNRVRMMEAIPRHPTIINDLANWKFLDDDNDRRRK